MMNRLPNKLLIMLLAISLFFPACEGDKGEPGPEGPQGAAGPSGEDGKDGKDGNTTSFYFQQGFKGYEGTQDMSIYNNPTSGLFSPINPLPTPEGKFLSAGIQEIDATTIDSVTTLLRFDDLNGIIENELGESICSGAFFINEAILYLSGIHSITDDRYMQLGIYGDDAPQFDEATVTWQKANGEENWSIPGGEEPWAYHNALYSSAYPDLNLGYLYPLASSSLSLVPMEYKPFMIPREAVKKWLCEEVNNGVRMAIFASDGLMVIYSSEHPDQELRPLLYINIDKNDPNTRVKVLSAKEELALWNQKSYEEKMEPLYRLYPSLRPE